MFHKEILRHLFFNVYPDTVDASLRIIGAGRLGSLVGALWSHRQGACDVVLETQTPRRHTGFLSQGYQVALRGSESIQSHPYVVFCVPPSQTQSYLTEVNRALSFWNRTGIFVFSSSTAVYAEETGQVVDEGSELSKSDRAQRLLEVENLVLARGGNVVRLAGLYDVDTGPHQVYLRSGEIQSDGEGFLNLIHYEDAALLVDLILNSDSRGQVYLGCDNHPLRRREILERAESYFQRKGGEFRPLKTELGKRCDNSWTRQALSWKPKWISFLRQDATTR